MPSPPDWHPPAGRSQPEPPHNGLTRLTVDVQVHSRPTFDLVALCSKYDNRCSGRRPTNHFLSVAQLTAERAGAVKVPPSAGLEQRRTPSARQPARPAPSRPWSYPRTRRRRLGPSRERTRRRRKSAVGRATDSMARWYSGVTTGSNKALLLGGLSETRVAPLHKPLGYEDHGEGDRECGSRDASQTARRARRLKPSSKIPDGACATPRRSGCLVALPA